MNPSTIITKHLPPTHIKLTNSNTCVRAFILISYAWFPFTFPETEAAKTSLCVIWWQNPSGTTFKMHHTSFLACSGLSWDRLGKQACGQPLVNMAQGSWRQHSRYGHLTKKQGSHTFLGHCFRLSP